MILILTYIIQIVNEKFHKWSKLWMIIIDSCKCMSKISKLSNYLIVSENYILKHYDRMKNMIEHKIFSIKFGKIIELFWFL